MLYNQKVQDLFLNPHNLGEIENADGVGEVGNVKCGDIMKIWIKVNPETQVLEDIKFKTFGCAAAIATSSIITDMAKGKTIDEAEKITNQAVADELGGLPPLKMHCSNLAADALKKAIEDYSQRQLAVGSEEKKEKSAISRITPEMTIADLIEQYPQLIEVLAQFGFHCIGCQMSVFETVADAAYKHGVDLDELLETLNAEVEMVMMARKSSENF